MDSQVKRCQGGRPRLSLCTPCDQDVPGCKAKLTYLEATEFIVPDLLQSFWDKEFKLIFQSTTCLPLLCPILHFFLAVFSRYPVLFI